MITIESSIVSATTVNSSNARKNVRMTAAIARKIAAKMPMSSPPKSGRKSGMSRSAFLKRFRRGIQ